jgi:hypothetical protein
MDRTFKREEREVAIQGVLPDKGRGGTLYCEDKKSCSSLLFLVPCPIFIFNKYKMYMSSKIGKKETNL